MLSTDVMCCVCALRASTSAACICCARVLILCSYLQISALQCRQSAAAWGRSRLRPARRPSPTEGEDATDILAFVGFLVVVSVAMFNFRVGYYFILFFGPAFNEHKNRDTTCTPTNSPPLTGHPATPQARYPTTTRPHPTGPLPHFHASAPQC